MSNEYDPNVGVQFQVGTIPIDSIGHIKIRVDSIPIGFILLWVRTRILRNRANLRKTKVLANYEQIEAMILEMNPDLREGGGAFSNLGPAMVYMVNHNPFWGTRNQDGTNTVYGPFSTIKMAQDLHSSLCIKHNYEDDTPLVEIWTRPMDPKVVL